MSPEQGSRRRTSAHVGRRAPSLSVLTDEVSAPEPPAAGQRRPRARLLWLSLVIVWLLSTAYMATMLKRGWVPHDEGAFGESAMRVLAGELPHRDFDEIYTGGLSYLHAFAFRELGTNLASLRIVLFVFFLAWVPAVYYIASRFASPLTAGGITLLAVAWSLPNYAAAVPSWYNLFFAVFGTAAVLRYLETGSRWWLFVAGVCGGLSFLAKSAGLYYVAAVLLSLTFREQCLTHAEPGETRTRGRIYSVFVVACLLLFVALLSALVRSNPRSTVIIQFVLPGAALAVLLLGREARGISGRDWARFATLLRMLVPYGVGIAIPIAIFLVPYAVSGSLAAFVRGVFLLPTKRLIFAAFTPPELIAALAMVPLVALLGIAMRVRGPLHWIYGAATALGYGMVLAASAEHPSAYRFAWHSLDLLIPLTVVVGVVLLNVPRAAGGFSLLRQQQVMLLLCVTGMCNLVRFPFTAPIYFCYVSPLLALSLLAVLSWREQPPRFLLGSLLVFYLLFAVLRFTPSFIYAMGDVYISDPESQPLRLERAGGLRVDPDEAEEYERLIPVIQQHAAGEYIYAAPDCPEVYFLSGLRNPIRTLFDFFDDPTGRNERILSAIETHQVKVVAIFSKPEFSVPLAPEIKTVLAERFPYSTTVGRFEVRWRP